MGNVPVIVMTPGGSSTVAPPPADSAAANAAARLADWSVPVPVRTPYSYALMVTPALRTAGEVPPLTCASIAEPAGAPTSAADAAADAAAADAAAPDPVTSTWTRPSVAGKRARTLGTFRPDMSDPQSGEDAELARRPQRELGAGAGGDLARPG